MPTPTAQPDPRLPRREPGARAGWSIALLLVFAAWIGACSVQSAGTVHLDGWQPNLDAGMAAAQEQDRPMLVMFTADWCGPCQALKHDVLQTDHAKNAIAAGFVPVMIDLTDQSASNPNMPAAQRYRVQAIPTLILTDAEGNPIPGTLTYPNRTYPRTPEGFVDWLDSAERAQAEAASR